MFVYTIGDIIGVVYLLVILIVCSTAALAIAIDRMTRVTGDMRGDVQVTDGDADVSISATKQGA